MASEDILHPYQCAARLPTPAGHQVVLLAARETVYQIDVENAQQTAHWAASVGKKQITSISKAIPVTLLAASRCGKLVAAVTGEDKTVHILDVENGLAPTRDFTLPKRPCAVTFTPDSSRLLCGDKFGDVYALPVDERANYEPSRKKLRTAKASAPAATSLTVHTKGNLKALEYQKKLAQKAAERHKDSEPQASEFEFPFTPVIGHVSMLTDIVATRVSTSPTGTNDGTNPFRDFIVTADRDEHIRVSRGLPQSHVIHGFCLEHQQFISKLCLLRSGLLVSGGGDDYLCVWNWQQSSLVAKIDLRKHLTHSDPARGENKFAVSGIRDCSDVDDATSFLCTCEGYSLLLHVQAPVASTSPSAFKTNALPLRGTPLDVVFLPHSSSQTAKVLISLDNIHESGSLTSTREMDAFGPRLQVFELSGRDGDLLLTESAEDHAEQINVQCTPQAKVECADVLTAQLSSSFYGIENLRKRGAEDAELDAGP